MSDRQVLPTKGLNLLPMPHSDENCHNHTIGSSGFCAETRSILIVSSAARRSFAERQNSLKSLVP
jgi:hypothetical protein